MQELWHRDFDALEAISQNDFTRRLFLRMANLSQVGKLEHLILELQNDDDLDHDTKGDLAELASDPAFIFAVRDYLRRTHVAH